MVTSHTASIVEGFHDFPPDQTRTSSALLLISRAYQTHGKSRSWNIQTTPIWSNLDITEDDYDFMLAHRRVGDDPRDPDEISSRGYFCARVTIQQSANALRIMHAGSHKLPKGSVIICPSSSVGFSREYPPSRKEREGMKHPPHPTKTRHKEVPKICFRYRNLSGEPGFELSGRNLSRT
jgi:hypothetical protein